MFTAFHRHEVLAHGASLDTVLAFASGVVDPSLARGRHHLRRGPCRCRGDVHGPRRPPRGRTRTLDVGGGVMSKKRRPQPPQLSPTPPPPCTPAQLTEAREKLWKTPEEFAAYSGYSVKLLARMEAGDKEIPGPMRRIVHTIETRLTPPPPPRSPAQLTAARERFGMTPAEFAAELCVSEKTAGPHGSRPEGNPQVDSDAPAPARDEGRVAVPALTAAA